MAQVIEYLASKYKALNSNPSTAQNKKIKHLYAGNTGSQCFLGILPDFQGKSNSNRIKTFPGDVKEVALLVSAHEATGRRRETACPVLVCMYKNRPEQNTAKLNPVKH
jgi:hypothetical protein